MIANQDIKLEKQAYYLGARVIDFLKAAPLGQIDIGEIYVAINEHERVSYHSFAMALNWLFLLGALDYMNGKIVKCF